MPATGGGMSPFADEPEEPAFVTFAQAGVQIGR
jgi:hypothetical protein